MIESSLPLPDSYVSDDLYLESLLHFVSTSELHSTLCGGVHILDFFTRIPDLYESILDSTWRDWFELLDMNDILDLILREDIKSLLSVESYKKNLAAWRGKRAPPLSLLLYIHEVRSLCLQRQPKHQEENISIPKIPPHVAIGMKEKKVHEVSEFAAYIDRLTARLDAASITGPVTALVDFGSGQNYLGRTLASKPYNRYIIAVEGRPHNVEGARSKDVVAGLAQKSGIWRNKKIYRAQKNACTDCVPQISTQGESNHFSQKSLEPSITSFVPKTTLTNNGPQELKTEGGSVCHISKQLDDGDLSSVVDQISTKAPNELNLLVMSLHSCGNLSHHGLRSLVENKSVSAVAIVGCCYNLLTESSDLHFDRKERDPQGFPMSNRLKNYSSQCAQDRKNKGISLSITPRMLAVQAPQNWTNADSSDFFTRHFFRALLQRIFLDRGAVDPPAPWSYNTPSAGRSAAGTGGSMDGGGHHSAAGGTPIIIGSLRKQYYSSFLSYVRGALTKLSSTNTSFASGHDLAVARVLDAMRDISDAEIEDYYERYKARKKHISVVWTLMAFSAQLIEAVIVLDRWQWLREQKGVVGEARVEAVWDYRLSPRNLVVVGMKSNKEGEKTWESKCDLAIKKLSLGG